MSRLRLWLGIIGLVMASYAVFAPAERFDLAWDRIVDGWPYALAALAVLNLTRSVLRSMAALLGPILIGLAAAIYFVRPSIETPLLLDILLVAIVVGASALVLSALPPDSTWTRVLWTGRARGPSSLAGPLRAVAVLGELRLDLLGSRVNPRTTITVIAVGGRVVLDVPQEWRVVARPPSRMLLFVSERGRRDKVTVGTPDLVVRLVGAVGAVELQRI